MRIRIGSRGSALALWQAEHVRGRLEGLGHEIAIHRITTTGDRIQDRRLEAVGGKGAFLKEIEEALLASEVDLAVHSLKDMPVVLPDGLRLAAVLERADPRDALVSGGRSLDALPAGARVGTSSLRRQALLCDLRPDLVLADLRGNVDTRLLRRTEGRFDAIVLAMAGLVRLRRAGEASQVLDPVRFVPAPGQGAIGLECREGDHGVTAAVAALDHAASAAAVTAERAFLASLGGGCNVPLGAYAQGEGTGLRLIGFVARPDGTGALRGERVGGDPAGLGRDLARDLLDRGAADLLGR